MMSTGGAIKVAAGAIMAVALGSYILQPTVFYDAQGQNKAFGTGQNETVLPLWLVCMIVGLSIYLGNTFVTALNQE